MRHLLALSVSSAVLCAVLVLAGAPPARACPGCIESVKVAGGSSGDVLAGFSVSVLFMLGAVAGVGGGLTMLVVKAARAAEAARAGTDEREG